MGEWDGRDDARQPGISGVLCNTPTRSAEGRTEGEGGVTGTNLLPLATTCYGGMLLGGNRGGRRIGREREREIG